MSEYHNPVLLNESVDALVQNPDGIYADATFGGGGHSREILSRLSPKALSGADISGVKTPSEASSPSGRGPLLISFDRDNDAISRAASDPDFQDERFILVHNNFRFIHNYALLHAEEGLDGVLADLGVSSHQFDTAERGFSFRYEAPLDMRMNVQGTTTAADIVNSYTQEELEKILRIYGEVENSRKAASLIVSARAKAPILTTTDLDNALAAALPSFAEHKYLAKVYQALRIEVNQEMRSLEKFLEGATKSLKKGGRLVVITYHSLEDRMVKNFIKSGNIDGEIQQDQIYGGSTAPLRAVNRKPILPSEEEIAGNTRARSAKLRIAEKI